jgi:Flp pilus assembly protein TadG
MLSRRQRGQVIVWVVVMLPFFLATAGLVIDAGRVLDARREVQNVADGAARVAAMQIDAPHLRDTGDLRLDQDRARDAAQRYIRDQAAGEGWETPRITPSAGGVQVQVARRAPTSFLRIINVESLVTVQASALAEPCVGILNGTRPIGQRC